MSRLLMLVESSDQATPPEGELPSLTVHGESTSAVSFEGDAPERGRFRLERHDDRRDRLRRARRTFGNEQDRIRFSAMGEGYLGPSPEEGLLEGSVIWRVEEGEGRFAGATGLITSNFALRAETGEVAEKQVISPFLP